MERLKRLGRTFPLEAGTEAAILASSSTAFLLLISSPSE